MKKLLLGSSALVAAMMAGPAMAADVARGPVYKAAPAGPTLVMPAWTGPYIGAHCGAAWSRTKTSTLESAGLFEWGVNDSGGFCGGQLGYNLQQGNYLFGLEGDLSHLWLEATNSVQTGAVASDVLFSEVKYSWLGTLTGRLGLIFDQSVFYVKGGAAIARIKNSTFQTSPSVRDDPSETTKNKVGWTLGGGWEYAWTPNWSWKVEYLYMDFGSATSINPDGDVFDHRNRLHTIKIGINYRWGAGPVVARY